MANPGSEHMRRIVDWGRRWKIKEWWFSVFWLWGLVPGLGHLGDHHHPGWVQNLALAGAAVFAAAFVTVVALARNRSHPRIAAGCVAVTAVLAVAYPLLFGDPWLAMFIYVTLGNAWTHPLRRAVWTTGLVVTLQWGIALAIHDRFGDYWPWLAATAIAGGFSILGVERARNQHRLRRGEEAMAQLAVNEERLRFARDLHDLLGHSLSLLSLKAQLAERMVHTDPDGCARQIAEIREITATALAEVRESVTGYRRPTLGTELARAHTALTAAGIRPDIDPDVESRATALSPAREAALAWALRESVTNILRHGTGARTCRIHLSRNGDEYTLTVQDDGAAPAGAQFGNGLSGLRERLALEDGRLEAGPAGGGFRVRAHVPATHTAVTPVP